MNILIVDDEMMVLEDTEETVKKVFPDAVAVSADNYRTALEYAKETKIDVAMLDIEMPGMTGLELARQLKDINPLTNIIFVTAYAEYALEAFGMYASGYLMKPVTEDDIKKAFDNLRHPETKKDNGLKVQCFGNFEVFFNGEPLQFPRAKAKELLAYLIDLRGASANTGELCAVLWEDSTKVAQNKHYLRNLISDLKKVLQQCNAGDVFVTARNSFSVDVDKIDCDYYRYIKNDPEAVSAYRGEYMKQYSWAEFSMITLKK
ncbi:MAG: response regulator [Clostridia bacterium]|nr:response regulator [[Bacteroides] pectinophilus]MDD5873400.1 response regulator [Clostridia bacterium]